jgi:hypothetical protein
MVVEAGTPDQRGDACIVVKGSPAPLKLEPLPVSDGGCDQERNRRQSNVVEVGIR